MKQRSEKAIVPCGIIFLFFLLPLLPAGALENTIPRTEDPVIIPGRRLSLPEGVSPGSLGVMIYIKGKFYPIPFQVDERAMDGMYAYQYGEEARKDEDPGLDGNDELVFMSGDLGGKAPPGAAPPGAEKGVELELSDPVSGGKGWAYLYTFHAPAPRSTIDYARLTLLPGEGKKKFSGQDSRGQGFAMSAPYKTLCPDDLYFLGPGGTSSPDLLDAFKIRGHLKTKFLIAMDFKLDRMIKSRLLGYNDGPVRVIYSGDGTFNLGFIKMPGRGVEQVKAYRSQFDEEISFTMPFKFSSTLKEFPLKGRMDFTPAMKGFKVHTDIHPPGKGIVLDGSQSPGERALDFTSPCGWVSGHSSLGAMLFRMEFDTRENPEWKKVERFFYLKEDPNFKDKPEEIPGEMAVGLGVRNTELMDTDWGKLRVLFYFYHDYEPGKEKLFLSIEDQPLEVTVNPR